MNNRRLIDFTYVYKDKINIKGKYIINSPLIEKGVVFEHGYLKMVTMNLILKILS